MDKKNHLVPIKKMNLKKELIVGRGMGVILAAIVITLQFNQHTVNAGQSITIPEIAQDASLPKAPLTVKSSPDEIIALMLNSHTQWQTIEASAITSFNDTAWETNIQLEQYGKGRGDYGPAGLKPEFSWLSDGNTLWQVDLTDKVYEEYALPEDIKSLASYGPTSLPVDETGTFIIRYPLEGTFPSMLSSFFFPHGLAQSFSQRQIDVLGSDKIAGRDAVVILTQIFDNEGKLVKKHEYWIDTSTGVILQSRVYTEATGWDKWAEQTTVTKIVYDIQFSDNTFKFEPAQDWQNISTES